MRDDGKTRTPDMEVLIHILPMTAQEYRPNHEDFKSYTVKVKNLKTTLCPHPLIE